MAMQYLFEITCFSVGFEYCNSAYAWGAAAHRRDSSVSPQDEMPIFDHTHDPDQMNDSNEPKGKHAPIG